jgi:hypothetical protein
MRRRNNLMRSWMQIWATMNLPNWRKCAENLCPETFPALSRHSNWNSCQHFNSSGSQWMFLRVIPWISISAVIVYLLFLFKSCHRVWEVKSKIYPWKSRLDWKKISFWIECWVIAAIVCWFFYCFVANINFEILAKRWILILFDSSIRESFLEYFFDDEVPVDKKLI